MRYFVIFLILIGLAGMMLLFDNALAEDPPLILTKVELWGPSSFIANNVKSCIDNTIGQLGPWAVGWIEIQNTKDKTITAQDITLRVGSIHSTIPITLEANESCIFKTEDQITTRIGPGGSEGNGPPYGYDGSTVVFDYIVEENGKKIHYVDTTPEISDTFGDTRIWQLVDDDWLFKEGSIDNILQRTNGGSVVLDRTVYPVPWEDRPPLKQLKDGIDPRVIHCNDKLVLIQKHDGSPACVKPETKEKLIERGWAISDEKPLFVEISLDKFTPSQAVGYPIDDFTIKLEGYYPRPHAPDIQIINETGHVIWTNYDDIGHVILGRISPVEFCKEYQFNDIGGALTFNKTGTYKFIFTFEEFSLEQEIKIHQSTSSIYLDKPNFHCK